MTAVDGATPDAWMTGSAVWDLPTEPVTIVSPAVAGGAVTG